MKVTVEESFPPKVNTFKRGELVKWVSEDKTKYAYVMVTRDSDCNLFNGVVLATNVAVYDIGEVSTGWQSKDFTLVTKATIFYER
jgi:hypothetical protein